MALVFTALADSTSALLLHTHKHHPPPGNIWVIIGPQKLISLAMISIGLYGFGMSFNDIVDRRRDAQLASYRPLPSGRIGVVTAHVVCGMLAAMALVGVLLYSRDSMTLMIFGFTISLIVFYDLAGKYLVAPGLLTLGFIRFFHAVLPAPHVAVPWHPLLLLNHIAVVSTIAYRWEQKRPPLTKRHWWAVLGGLAAVDLAMIWAAHMTITRQLLLPAAAVALFAALALWTLRRKLNARQAGQTLMLLGLLWLIVYDAAFVAAFVGMGSAAVILALLPVAYLSVQLMRWSSRIVAISQRPAFKRVEV